MAVDYGNFLQATIDVYAHHLQVNTAVVPPSTACTTPTATYQWIDDSTLVIGLSAGRPHPLVVRAMKLARHRKASTVAITDATLSEVAKLAQVRLYYSSNSPAYVRSHTALLSTIQALAYGVYARDMAQYADRIKAFRLK